MRIEQFSDEHGIYFRASEEAFLVSKEQAASIRKHIDELRELVRFALHRCNADNPMCDACCDGYDGECELRQRMRELGVDA